LKLVSIKQNSDMEEYQKDRMKIPCQMMPEQVNGKEQN
jgi:hypothetical protein